MTVQLDAVVVRPGDGIGRVQEGGSRAGDGADGPVFVDASGRRSRRFRRIGMAIALACAVYAIVIVATLISGNSNAPWLPVPGPQDDAPAGKVDTSPLPADPAQPSVPAGASPETSAPTPEDPTPSPGTSAQVPGVSPSPDRPGTSADPEPTATHTTEKPGSGGTAPNSPPPSTPASPTPDDSPTSGGQPTSDPSPPDDGGTDPTDGTTASGPSSQMPVTGEPSPSSSLPENVL
ncbi:hypothetical protein NGF19_00150 [Streptomyces sp. RY43-2]|uniref:Uncharacterized protein n=1 Tax=Streptomyces macrolidinus TaxID=2952607 RepID=A0ABT0Z618_9ACTN|nr:hypothetical protein [Streptomyces macrolidinus]MCN9239214.1 hypothetical protein [Streptomyces macrolidinus]